MNKPNMSVEIAGIKMKNPVMPASGCFGFGEEYTPYFDLNELGAIVVKSVTMNETVGNPGPRVCETPAGMLNAIGWQNPGADVFINEKMPFLRQFNTPVIVNLAGKTVKEYADLAARLDGVDGLSGMELNISCPNVNEGGVAFGTDPKLAAEVIGAVRSSTKLPLIVKLSPNVTDITVMARAAEEAGADAISLINTFTAIAIDIKTRKPIIGNFTGGLSGPAVKPVALYMTYRVAQTVKVPIIGMGGILRAEDAIEFLLAGATAVAVGMGTFVNPTAMPEIIHGIEDYLIQNNFNDVHQIIGGLICD
ncbi:dihydroorotate dehydrogenase [Hydrogenoanaerobacterium sp.]|uniref:dihydroorotate dehydrogenase n=1 Tax=Hydrogenoanaerobacterium sp. TaxID=2953763 RepID=UPI00289AAAD6|nr:dihydroorotate dehydrogenase [Hydrogenoanaerobacterium sp.]